MSRALTRRLINFKKVMCGKIKPAYCSKMVYLRLEGLKISDTLINAILHSCPDIHTFIFNRSDGFSNTSIIEIAKFSPKLQYLSLNSCLCLTDRCIIEIARSCSKLRHLEFRYCLIGNKAVEEIAHNCTNLKYLDLVRCKRISEEVIEKIKIEYPDTDSDTSDLSSSSTSSSELDDKHISKYISAMVKSRNNMRKTMGKFTDIPSQYMNLLNSNKYEHTYDPKNSFVIVKNICKDKSWRRLTIKKRDPLTEIEAGNINLVIENFLKHEVERYNQKKERQHQYTKIRDNTNGIDHFIPLESAKLTHQSTASFIEQDRQSPISSEISCVENTELHSSHTLQTHTKYLKKLRQDLIRYGMGQVGPGLPKLKPSPNNIF
ncbi:hypothetical protein Glove_456g43 [Diversispora epigaea]|uniref:RNI-like protein n=1 Tax=Diversispora epigaea TaxID=1348612 RepID=A0A397GP87_9GLOM|nr:hypothetical protein Glove_456g43 [Diversispora epigaea]